MSKTESSKSLVVTSGQNNLSNLTGFDDAILYQPDARDRVYRRFIFWLTALLILALAWSAIGKTYERAFAPGQVIPSSFVQPIQHLEGGIVTEILAREGEFIRKGEPIIRLAPIQTGADYGTIESQIINTQLQLERLEYLLFGITPDWSVAGESFQANVTQQKALMKSQGDLRDGELQILTERVTQLQEQRSGLNGRRENLAEEVGLLEEEVAIQTQLFDQGLGSRLNLVSAQQSLARARGDYEGVIASLAELESQLLEARRSIIQARQTIESEWMLELSDLTARLLELKAQAEAIEDRYERLVVTAPMDGYVNALDARGIGQVLAPGEKIAELVPDSATLLAEVKVSPLDIGYIEQGQETQVRFDAFNFSRYGAIPGRVIGISPSNIQTPEGEVYFRVMVQLDKNYLGENPNRNRISTGMTVTADIRTGEKSIMAYMWRPIHRVLVDSFAER